MNSQRLTKGCFCAVAAFAVAAISSTVWASPGAIIEEVESSSVNKVLPQIITQTAPIYPQSLARSGTEGVVTVSFTVDTEGRVLDPEVVSSAARALNPYALKTVAGWRFTPGERDGKVATFRLRASVEFSAKGVASSDEGVRAPVAPFAQGAPAKRKVTPVYPYEALIAGRAGWAEASFIVDYTGRALFANPAGASDTAFAKAVVAMVEASEFIPDKKDRRPVMTPANQRVTFEGEASLDPEARRVLSELRKQKPAILTMADLDERPKAVRQDSPAYPRALKDDGLTGQAEIEFIVDREGRVLFPRIVSASHEDFGWAAATAVAQWRFQPPTKDGQKVDVRMMVPVLFDARKLAASD